MQLTETFIEQVIPPMPGLDGKGTQAFYRDSSVIGFGLRVASGGAKSWILERRIRGKVKRITLGRCNAISLEKAKSRAIKLIGEIKRENTPRFINGKIVTESINLQEAFNEYLVAHPRLGQLTIDDYRRSMQGPLHNWCLIPIRDLSETNVLEKHRAYTGKGEARCNNAMRLLRAVLNYAKLHLNSAHHKPVITSNPVDVLSRKKLWHPFCKRQTGQFIRPQQLNNWWQATQHLRKETTRDYLRFLLLTGLPHTIASGLTFDDVDFDNKIFKVRINDDQDSWLILPLPSYLNNLIRESASNRPHTDNYIFPGLVKEKPISDPRTALKRVQKISGVRFSINDLHRTFIYLAGKSAINQPTLDLISVLFKRKDVAMTDEDLNLIREIQEGVFATVSGLTDAGK